MTLASSGVRADRCACGGVKESGGECAACQARKARVSRPMSSDTRSTVEHVLSTPGRSLESSVRTPAEGALRADFSRVRIHTGEDAARSAAAMRAKAYTV